MLPVFSALDGSRRSPVSRQQDGEKNSDHRHETDKYEKNDQENIHFSYPYQTAEKGA